VDAYADLIRKLGDTAPFDVMLEVRPRLSQLSSGTEPPIETADQSVPAPGMRCPQCGAYPTAGDRFCRICGALLEVPAVNVATSRQVLRDTGSHSVSNRRRWAVVTTF